MATSNAQPARGFPLLPLAEVALAALTVATVASMWRLFAGTAFFLPLAAHAIAAHALAAALRRQGVGPGAAALACLGAAMIALSWGHLWDTTWYGLPTGETWRSAVDQLEIGWRTFGHVRAPAPVLTGFLLSAGTAVWVGAFLADLAAFRQWTPFEALIPSGTLFLFTSIFAADRARVLAAVLWITAAMAFVLLHRTARQQGSPSWLGSDARIGSQALVRAGAGLALGAVCVAWLFGPRLPGAGAEALAPFARDDRQGGRTTISPLVEMRGRLVEQSQVELFTVTTTKREYWRMTALDIFDGEVWSSRGTFGEADGRLAGSGNRDVRSTPVTQTFSILDLSTIWLPAAFEATELQVAESEVRWDDVSSTLIVSRDLDTSDGLDYEVVSDVPAFTLEDLERGGDIPGDLARHNTELPRDFPQSVRAEAQRIVAEAATPYEQAVALQDSFRDGRFSYSLLAPRGHSDSAIEDFLFVTRSGYCEQFAAAYAAMARSIGLPTRVAVGFTPGQPDPSDPNRYIVRGENAHAWPEVYLAGAGWVGFDPTPGRGAPGAEAWTGHPEAQDAAGLSTDATLVPQDDPAPGTGQPGEEPTATTAPPLTDVGAEPEALGPGSEPVSVPTSAVVVALLVGIPAAALILAIGGALVAAGRAVGRHRRRAAADTPEAVVLVAGDEAAEAVVVLGLSRRAHETRLEYGRRLAIELHAPEARHLGDLLTRAEFDPAGVTDDEADEAGVAVDRIRERVRERAAWWKRALATADPRSPIRRAQARSRSQIPRPTGPRVHITLAPTDH